MCRIGVKSFGTRKRPVPSEVGGNIGKHVMTIKNLNLVQDVRYNLFSDTQQNHPMGYLLNGIYYEAGNEQPIGKLEDGVFYYFMVNSGGTLANGNPAGRLDGDCIVRTTDDHRFSLVAAD